MRKVLLLLILNILPYFGTTNVINISDLQVKRAGPKLIKKYGAYRAGANHECYRECKYDDARECVYNFAVGTYSTMSTDCGDCPFNQTDCQNPLCVTAGGNQRLISVVNEQLPGPAVLVCENDTIVVNLHNTFDTDSTTIHFHGSHQKGTPWMDGVPFITQCPVQPGTSYQHKFVAKIPGTHMWHGHSGTHEADGLFGQYVVRKPEDFNNPDLYDHDIPEHTMMFWHWFEHPVGQEFSRGLYQGHSLEAYDIIINGKGAKKVFTSDDGKNYTTPRAVFVVEQGKRYRFRAIFNSIMYCPVQVSIDNHNLTMIASDSGEFKPIEVETFIGNAGERFDFVLNANAPSGTYWIRVRGLGGNCGGRKIHQEAILQYEASELETPRGHPLYEEADRSGKLLNPMDLAHNPYPKNDVVQFIELESPKPTRNISGTPDVTVYLEFKVNAFVSQRTDYPQINNLTFAYPQSPLLTQSKSDTSCHPKLKHYNCVENFCTCPYTESFPKDSLVEVVLVALDLFPIGDHPMHLHGNHYQVVAMDTIGANVSTEHVRELNLAGKITKKLKNVPYKDSFSVPSQGYAIFRFIADNPGYWFFHCHFSFHAARGMAVVFKVGEDVVDIPTAPQDIPTCGNFPSLPPYY